MQLLKGLISGVFFVHALFGNKNPDKFKLLRAGSIMVNKQEG
jgi:hypothetical protein